jgi:hypothetical protein
VNERVHDQRAELTWEETAERILAQATALLAQRGDEEAVALLVDLQAKVGPASIRRHGLAVLSTGGTPRVASKCSLTSFTALVSVVVFLGVVGVAEFADGAGARSGRTKL